MSKYCYLIDAGHGGWLIDKEHPNGYYPTAGKRSPKIDGKTLIYEGVNNRANCEVLIQEFKNRSIDYVYLTDTQQDISLKERVRRANEIGKQKKCIYISMHSNAAGNGANWANARGISLHIAKKHSQNTELFTGFLWEELQKEFQGVTRFRGIRFNDFYVVKYTSMPAVLCEWGFHDNLEDAKLMLTDEWRQKISNSICNAIEEFETL